MINVIVIKGGLGNQMFCYAFFRAIKHNIFFNIHLLEIEPSVNRHNGLEIFKIFRASGMWRSKMYSFCFKYLKTWIQSFETVVQKNSIEYSPCLIKKRGKQLDTMGIGKVSFILRILIILYVESFDFEQI